jgi:CRISPR/Cas system-associated protein Cas5 (RAMP superfamily)
MHEEITLGDFVTIVSVISIGHNHMTVERVLEMNTSYQFIKNFVQVHQ